MRPVAFFPRRKRIRPLRPRSLEPSRRERSPVEPWLQPVQEVGDDLAGDRNPKEAAAVEASDQDEARGVAADQGEAVQGEAHDPGPATRDADAGQGGKEADRVGGKAGDDSGGDALLIVAQSLVVIEAAEAAVEDLAVRGLTTVLLVGVSRHWHAPSSPIKARLREFFTFSVASDQRNPYFCKRV